MPNRILREGILSSERVNSLSPRGELFYRRLMSVVDDYGRIEALPQLLLAKCYPLQLDRLTVDDVKACLEECAAGPNPLITVYTVRGKTYLQVNNFGQRERVSKCPSPQDAAVCGQMPAHDGEVRQDAAESGGTPQNAAYARASNTTPTTPTTTHLTFPERGLGETKVSPEPTREFFEPELFENLIGLFIALGRGVGIGDRIQCENAWKGLTQAERRRAHEYAMAQRVGWQSRPTDKIAQPWNYLKEKHWERDAPRLLAQTRELTRSELAQDAAERRFLGAKR